MTFKHFCLLFLLLPLTVNAQQEKLSAWLRESMEAGHDIGNMRRTEDAKEMLTTVFVRTSETLTEDSLLKYGGIVYAQLGDIYIITIPLSQVGKLIELSTVLRVEANRRARVTLDTVSRINNILPVYVHSRAKALSWEWKTWALTSPTPPFIII